MGQNHQKFLRNKKLRAKNKEAIIENIYEYVQKKMKAYEDEEMKNNFFLNFLEKDLDKIITKIENKEIDDKELYLKGAVKNRYRLFVRENTKNNIETSYFDNSYFYNHANRDDFSYDSNQKERFWNLLLAEIECFPDIKRIMLKLYLNIIPNTYEWKILINKYGVEKTKEFLKKYREHLEKKLKEIDKKNQALNTIFFKYLKKNNSKKCKHFSVITSRKKNTQLKFLKEFFKVKNYTIYKNLELLRKRLYRRFQADKDFFNIYTIAA